jgi:organic hydroperoxide reductase OsmC/OhrA
MFVGAIEMCHMLTFLAFAQKRHLTIQSYSSRADGILEFIDGAYRFTHVAINADIYVSDPSEVALVKAVVEQAKSRCLISNSVSALVSFWPVVRVQMS